MTDDPKKPTLVPPPEKTIVPLDRDKRLIERIEKLMANPPEGSVVLDYTPVVARHVLQHWRGTHNRNEKPAAILRYADDMAKDGWHLNGETIKFTDQNLLGDGQNRMIACIRSGRPFRSHTVFGIEHLLFHSMDQGRVRGPADVLHIAGVANALLVYPAVRWAELLASKIVKTRRTFTPPQILDLYQTKHKGVEDFIREARDIVSANKKQPMSLVMAHLYTFDKIDTALAAKFSEAWSTGICPGSLRAIQIMQHELEVLGGKVTRIHDVVRAAMIVNAWNIVQEDTKPRAAAIRWDFDQAFPKIAGTKEDKEE